MVLSSGFSEAGDEGRALQRTMIEAARRHGVRVLGPNCLGVMRTDVGLDATFARTLARFTQLDYDRELALVAASSQE